MNRICPLIIEDDIRKKPEKRRKTVRAIILNEHQEVLMVYADQFDDYTFPGGGVKDGESDVKALTRELREEIGAKKIKIIDSFGYINEVKYGLFKNDTVYLQKSIYFLVEIDGIGHQHLDHRESIHGVKPIWKKIDDVMKHNEHVSKDEKHQAYGLKTVLKRENQVLKKLKEAIAHEKI